ncbi:MAG: glutathione synthetase [Acidimicrobiia bacterium]|nr:glutathione synthetase [Acidimicrobiia bacterium]MDH5520602.1 glutathione synthetase [Acidimicrobiia bacterium]
MRVGFVVNDIKTEEAGYTTTRLGVALTNRGHEAWTINVGDLAYDPDELVRADASKVPKARYKDGIAYMRDLHGKNVIRERVTVDHLDVLFLRNVPSDEKGKREWAKTAALDFGRVAMRHGVIVLNDPNGLAKAENKMYFQLFPEEVRPTTLISRDRKLIREFVNDQGRAVIKPLHGSGGESVFLVRSDQPHNLNQMIDAVARDGYIIAQEYLPKAENGDTRLFLMNGEPLRHKGRYAAFRRVRSGGDMRSNLHAGGTLAKATLTDDDFRLAEIVRPKLVQDGMFLVGIDIVGDKLMEINVFSPGGLGSAQKLEGVNFNDAVVDSLERKVSYMGYYRRNFENVDLATL